MVSCYMCGEYEEDEVYLCLECHSKERRAFEDENAELKAKLQALHENKLPPYIHVDELIKTTARCARLAAAYKAVDTLLNSGPVQGACILASNHGFGVSAEQHRLIDKAEAARAALTADDKALAEHWRAMEAATDVLIEIDGYRTADWQLPVALSQRITAAVRAVDALSGKE